MLTFLLPKPTAGLLPLSTIFVNPGTKAKFLAACEAALERPDALKQTQKWWACDHLVVCCRRTLKFTEAYLTPWIRCRGDADRSRGIECMAVSSLSFAEEAREARLPNSLHSWCFRI
jgi:hypothetical protein